MNSKSNVFARVALFASIAGLLVWLGTLKPNVAPAGAGVVVVKQGNGGLNFEPHNNQAHLWKATLSGHATNAATSTTETNR